VGALAVGWFVDRRPAVDAAAPTDASLRTLAREAATRFPARRRSRSTARPSEASSCMRPSDPVARARRRAHRARLGLLVRTGAYERLAAAGLVGEQLAAGEGQIGNLDRGALVLTTGRRKTP
jgi:hypothetical protein